MPDVGWSRSHDGASPRWKALRGLPKFHRLAPWLLTNCHTLKPRRRSPEPSTAATLRCWSSSSGSHGSIQMPSRSKSLRRFRHWPGAFRQAQEGHAVLHESLQGPQVGSRAIDGGRMCRQHPTQIDPRPENPTRSRHGRGSCLYLRCPVCSLERERLAVWPGVLVSARSITFAS